MFHDNNSVKSICILRLSSIGDITHMIPIINTLRNQSPKLNITWIINKTEYELVKNMRDINFIITDKSDLIGSLGKILALRKKMTFDILLHMQVSLRSNIYSLFVKSNRKIGFSNSYSRNLHSLFQHETIKCEERMHVLDVFFCFLKKISIQEKLLDWSVNYTTEKTLSQLDRKRYAVFNPFTSNRKMNYREWDIGNYKSIAEYLNKRYSIDTIIVGGGSEYEKKMSKDLGKKDYIHNIVGKTNLQNLCKLLEDCELYIGPDSGTLHIASMLGKSVIGLYATSNPNRTGPYNNMSFVINKYPEALKKYKNKSELDAKWGERVRNKDAMALIKIEEVKQKIDEILV